jgi:U4/U6 small nuclear ribonucleoprotein PRP3
MDPSKMEQAVRKQVQARLDKHNEDNESRKLTKEQRKEKKERKRDEDTTEGVKVAAWWVKDLTHKLLRAKVDLNAQQYNLTGLVVERGVDRGGYVVIVEGGPKGIGKFKRLMDVRIKWRGEGMEDSSSEEEEEEDDEDGGGGSMQKSKYNRTNVCKLLWEGGAPNRKFQGFEFKIAKSEGEARTVLKDYGSLAAQQQE